jgi:hypothetical protein
MSSSTFDETLFSILTDRELVRGLYYYTERQVSLQRQGKLRDAVIARRQARKFGGMIRQRLDTGTWVG